MMTYQGHQTGAESADQHASGEVGRGRARGGEVPAELQPARIPLPPHAFHDPVLRQVLGSEGVARLKHLTSDARPVVAADHLDRAGRPRRAHFLVGEVNATDPDHPRGAVWLEGDVPRATYIEIGRLLHADGCEECGVVPAGDEVTRPAAQSRWAQIARWLAGPSSHP